MSRNVLIIANGAVNDGPMVHRALRRYETPFVIAADGGARMAQGEFDLVPDVVVGDMDSLSPAELTALEEQGVILEKHPAEKDENDLELALKWAIQKGAQHIRILGAFGKRIDQTFGNVYLLALEELQNVDVRLVSDNQEVWLVRAGTHVIDGQPGDTLSLLPLSGDVFGVRTTGLYFPLNGETLHIGPARGISNVLTENQATISVEKGMLLLIYTLGRA